MVNTALLYVRDAAKNVPHMQSSIVLTVATSYLLRQIIVDDDRMLSVVPEELSHGTAGVGSKILQRSSIRCGSTDHDGVFHSVSVSQPVIQTAQVKFYQRCS